MQVLITGMRGFTGRYVQNTLELAGHSVAGLKSNLLDADCLNKEIRQINPEAVIHLAALAFVGHANPSAFYEVNLIGTRNLLAALSANAPNIKSVLLASSANIYGNRSGGVLNEQVFPAPANDYAVSKLAMENMAQLWSERLPLFIVRPFNYTGVGQDAKFLIPKIVFHFKNKQNIIQLGNLDVWREFNDVRFVSEVYMQLTERPPIEEVINVCSGHAYSLREIIAICEQITGHSLQIKVNPDFIRENEVRVLTGDNTKLNKIIPFLPTYKIESTLKWMLEN